MSIYDYALVIIVYLISAIFSFVTGKLIGVSYGETSLRVFPLNWIAGLFLINIGWGVSAYLFYKLEARTELSILAANILLIACFAGIFHSKK